MVYIVVQLKKRMPLNEKVQVVMWLLLCFILSVAGCGNNDTKNEANNSIRQKSVAVGEKKRVLYIDSYNAELPWVQGMTKGITSTLGITVDSLGVVDTSKSSFDFKIIHMDTKRNKSKEYIKSMALKTKKVIDEWAPDVVIASDDNASKYVIKPYFKGSKVPFVFCGVNWSAQEYGFPVKNVTGVIEVQLIPQLIEQLYKLTEGRRVGFIKGASLSSDKEGEYFEKALGTTIDKRFVGNFNEWQSEFIKLQNEVDVLLIGSLGDITDWDRDEEKLKEFVETNIKIPTGAWDGWLSDVALVTLSTNAEEQGELAATSALRILNGTSPEDIPIVKNKKAAIILNMGLAKIIRKTFAVDLMESATLVRAEPDRILFVNSYHKGYSWSDGIEKGVVKALGLTVSAEEGIEYLSKESMQFRVVYMDTKQNKSEKFKKYAALRVKGIIDRWKPDVVIASDDVASKYLIAPFYKNAKLPFVFCGVNWDATKYGYPFTNVTGMIEVSPVQETIALLKQYAKGERLGYVGVNSLTGRTIIKYYKDTLGVKFTDGLLVDTYREWEKEYLRMQESVDMILWVSPIGIKGWDDATAIQFINKHTKIPTGADNDANAQYALLGSVKIAEEQGWWAGKTALNILSGTAPSDIPITANKRSKLLINMLLANKLGIKFSTEFLKKAGFVDNAH